MSVDLLAAMAHPDDAELLCGGTLARAASEGRRTGILDLTRGEMGSRGSPEIRAREAAAAAQVLGLSARRNAGLPDGHLDNTDAMRRAVVEHLRILRPHTILLPYTVGRHPDHRVASQLIRDAAFLSGLKNYPAEGEPFRPRTLCYALAFREDAVKPSFVVDISNWFEQKLQAIGCYTSQFDRDTTQGGEVQPNGQPFLDLIRTRHAGYGTLIRVAYGEPYWLEETLRIDDPTALSVGSL